MTGQTYAAVSDGASNNPGWEQITQGDANSTTLISDIFYGRDGVNTNASIVAAVLQRTRTPSSNSQLYDLATRYQHDTKNRLTSVIQDGHEIRTSYERC